MQRIIAWIRTSASGIEQVIASWGNAVTGQKWMVRLQNTGELAVGIWGAYIKTATAINDGRWHHIAAVLPPTTTPNVTGIKLYVDGQLQTNTTACASLAVNTALMDDVQIGTFLAANGSRTSWFNGLIDDLRLYDRALTDAEIAWLGQAGLVAHWPINEGQGAVVREMIAQAHARMVNFDSTHWTVGRAGIARENAVNRPRLRQESGLHLLFLRLLCLHDTGLNPPHPSRARPYFWANYLDFISLEYVLYVVYGYTDNTTRYTICRLSMAKAIRHSQRDTLDL